VTPDQIEQVRPQLVEFAGRMLAGLPRSDQRAKGELYVRGLLTDGARKSMQPMAARLRVDHQGLQQFITSSTWDHNQVRANVATWAADTLKPDAYVVDDSGYPKDGTARPRGTTPRSPIPSWLIEHGCVAPGRVFLMMSGIGRSGGWHWTCSIR
jgi:hypothetical protein